MDCSNWGVRGGSLPKIGINSLGERDEIGQSDDSVEVGSFDEIES